jgi:peptidoglycan hydrolase-like protein with peptidoglycan-binding domain
MTSSPSAAQNPSASSTSPQADSQMNRNARQNVSTSEVQQAQQQLKSQGLYNGSIDGVVGPETQTALSQFQRQQGLTVTAQLDQQTMDRLMSGGSTTRPNTDAARAPAPMGTQNPALQNPTTPNQSPGATPYR